MMDRLFGFTERKIKAIPSLFAFLFFYWGNPEHTERTRSTELRLSRTTTGNVFPCDVTVNNFSAKGNKSVDFGVCTFWRCLFTRCEHVLHLQKMKTRQSHIQTSISLNANVQR